MNITITIRRIDADTIEYEVIKGTTYHANREGVFVGPAADTPAVVVTGPTLWRASDADMIAAFREKYPGADIIL